MKTRSDFGRGQLRATPRKFVNRLSQTRAASGKPQKR
jgi:hypothetical protein